MDCFALILIFPRLVFLCLLNLHILFAGTWVNVLNSYFTLITLVVSNWWRTLVFFLNLVVSLWWLNKAENERNGWVLYSSLCRTQRKHISANCSLHCFLSHQAQSFRFWKDKLYGSIILFSLFFHVGVVLKRAVMTKKGKTNSNVADDDIIETLVVLSGDLVQVVAKVCHSSCPIPVEFL